MRSPIETAGRLKVEEKQLAVGKPQRRVTRGSQPSDSSSAEDLERDLVHTHWSIAVETRTARVAMGFWSFGLAGKVVLVAVLCLLLVGLGDADADAKRRSDDVRSPSAAQSKVIRPTAVRRTNATRTQNAAAPAAQVTTKLPTRGQKRPQPNKTDENMLYPSNDLPSLYVTSTEQPEPTTTPELSSTPSLGSKIQSIAANNLRPFANLFQTASTSSTITGRPLHNRRTATTALSYVTSTATAYSITTVGQIVFQPTFVTQTLTVSSTLTNTVVVPTVSTSTNVVITVSFSTIVIPIFSTTVIVIPRTIRV